MKKILTILGVVCLLSSGFLADSNATDLMLQWGSFTSETISLLGSPVYNLQGQKLATINAFVVDSQGRIVFAILWQASPPPRHIDARHVAGPFSALSITKMGAVKVSVFLNMDKRAMNSVPSFDGTNDVNNTEWAARIYQYFGQAPYWTQGEAGKRSPATKSLESGGLSFIPSSERGRIVSFPPPDHVNSSLFPG